METKRSQKARAGRAREDSWLDAALAKRIAQDYQPSMSNAKWVKLLTALANSPVEIFNLYWKILHTHADFVHESQWKDIDDWNEQGVCVVYDYSWLWFRDMEFVVIRSSNSEQLLTYLASVAKFDMELTVEGICVYGYRPKIDAQAS